MFQAAGIAKPAPSNESHFLGTLFRVYSRYLPMMNYHFLTENELTCQYRGCYKQK